MKICAAALFVVLLIALPLLSQKPHQRGATAKSSAALVKRGEYLVNNVGLCADCHSPRNEKGEYVRNKWLMGSPLFFKPTVPMPAWAEVAPRIAGLPGWSDEQAVRFLTSGVGPNGSPARIPMPPFRFSREDAEAVTAYLKLLGTQTASADQRGNTKQPKE